MKNYKLLKEELNCLEQNYLKWVEFWSLFNGALLVAYYNIPCYKDFLNLLIPILGIITSYCWYLSITGHRSWIQSKQSKLWELCEQEKEIYSTKYFDFEHGYCGKSVLPHFHSTYKIIKLFVASVLAAWIIALGHSLHTPNTTIMMITLYIMLLAIEHKLHWISGSDLSNHRIMGKKNSPIESACILKGISSKHYFYDIIIMIALGILVCWILSINITK